MTAASGPVHDDIPPLFSFLLGDTRLLVPAEAVEAVTAFTPPVPLPRVPAHIQGLVTYDQRALVLLDLERFLGLGDATRSARRRTLVVSAGGYRVGLPVDTVLGVVRPEPQAVRAGTQVFGGRLAEFVRAEVHEASGVGAWLDLERLLEAARV